ncbi:MAG: hypothetical protein COZ31_05530 [Nitrospirae bacterium CG_4_10_14_3_um_filter_44_29]|nr:MAG: hypothetical protein COZ31_05530 [Nitrospirae bacterium CG_4_10_14_3_um_filter_44_29]
MEHQMQLNKPLGVGSESTNEFKFHFKSAVPSDAQETKFLLVFRGKLGNESDAVIAAVLPSGLVKLTVSIFDYASGSVTDVVPSFC